jgi:hypothetical protein
MSDGQLEIAVAAEAIVSAARRPRMNGATRGAKSGLPDHAWSSSQLVGAQMAVLVAEQKSADLQRRAAPIRPTGHRSRL